jgi:hypothetical protein
MRSLPIDRARRRRAVLEVALGVVTALLLLVGWWPSPVDATVSAPLHRALDLVHVAGVPRALTSYDVIEFSANIALFVPFGVLAALLLRRRPWIAVLAGCALSCCIELGQLLFLPDRTASVFDVLANTTGTLLGVLAVGLARRVRR